MKKIGYLLLSLAFLVMCLSCNPLLTQYKDLNKDTFKKKYRREVKLIKPLLSKENNSTILIISWESNMLAKNAELYYYALLYDSSTGKRKYIRTTEKEPQKMIFSDGIIDKDNYRSFDYILDNYLNGNEEYLLSLKDAFSNAEVNYPYYIYDFTKHKKLRLRSFIIDKNGKVNK
jgi:hypothetical protein